MRKKSIAKSLMASATCVVCLMSVSACGDLVPQPKEVAASTSAPSFTLAQAQRVESRLDAAIAASDAQRDPAPLAQYVDGPEYQIRASQLQVLRATNQVNQKMEIPTSNRQVVLPLTTGWPRTVLVVTQATQDQQSERLLVLSQASAHSNYMLWGLVRLFSGVTLPKFPVSSIGAKAGTLEDTGLVATPRQALMMYANVLQNGSSSPYADKVASDQFRAQLQNLTDAVQQAVSASQGSQSQVFTPDYQSAKIIRSADGGDFVVARIDSVWTRYAGPGRQSEPASTAEKALFGNATPTSTMKVTYVNVVALYIPPASSGSKIEAMGAERQPIQVIAVPDAQQGK